jgi:hypothetical protein
VRDGQTSPHRPRLVVSHSTRPPLSPSPHANIFILKCAQNATHSFCNHHSKRERDHQQQCRPCHQLVPQHPLQPVLALLLRLRLARNRDNHLLDINVLHAHDDQTRVYFLDQFHMLLDIHHQIHPQQLHLPQSSAPRLRGRRCGQWHRRWHRRWAAVESATTHTRSSGCRSQSPKTPHHHITQPPAAAAPTRQRTPSGTTCPRLSSPTHLP